MKISVRLGIYAILFAAFGLAAMLTAPWGVVLFVLYVCATLWAVLVIETPKKRQNLTRRLSVRHYAPLYRRMMRPIRRFPRDWRLYDWAMRLAVVYPIGFLVVWWAFTGQEGRIGALPILRVENDWWPRLGAICALTLSLIAPSTESWASTSNKDVVRKISGWLPGLTLAIAAALATVIAGAFAGAFAFTHAPVAGAFVGAYVVAFAVAFSVPFPGAFAIAFAGAGAPALATATAIAGAGEGAGVLAFTSAGAFATASAFAGALTVARIATSGHGYTAFLILTCAIVTLLIAALAVVPWADLDSDIWSLFLFLGILPLLNAIFDYLSYVVTLTLIRCGLRAGWGALLLGAVDLAVAGALLLLSGTALVLVVAGANALSGVALFPLGTLIADIRVAPWDFIWLYAMLFSTVVPTLLHFAVACFSMIAAVPLSARQRLIGWIDSDDDGHKLLAPLALGLLWVGSITLPVALLWGLVATLAAVGGHPVGWYLGEYLDLMERLVGWLGQL